EQRIQCLDETEKDLEIVGVPFDYRGRTAVQIVARDVTGRKQIEAALRNSEMKFSASFHSAPVMMTISTIEDGIYLDVNDRFLRTCGFTREEVIGRTSVDLGWIWAEDRDRLAGMLRETGRVEDLGLTLHARDGRPIHAIYHGEPIDVDGRMRLLSIAVDVTELKRAERERLESEARFREFFERDSNCCYMISPEGLILNVNQSVLDTLGYDDKSELVGKPLLTTIYPASSRERAAELLARWKASGALKNEEIAVKTKSGRERTMLLNASAVRDDDRLLYSVSIQTDITERKRSEEALRESEARYRGLFENSLAGVILHEAGPDEDSGLGDYVCIGINRAFEEMTGLEAQNVVGRRGHWFLPAGDIESVFERYSRIARTGRPEAFEYFAETLDRHFLINAFQLQPGRFATVLLDITERKRAEEAREKWEAQLRQSQKMEAIGTLAGGIAHDFNNILAAVIGYTELATMSAPKAGKLRRYLDQVLAGCQRAKDLVRQILDFSRQSKRDRQPVEISPVIKETLKFLRSSLPTSIEITQTIDTEPLVVNSDPTQIHQILMNLCANAEFAMRGKGGRMEVSLTRVDLDETTASRPLDLPPAPYCRLTVSDTGHGMDRETMNRIFEPFYTTKAPGEGTGMGLAVVFGIVKDHGGDLKVYSEPGQGTTFQVYLPLVLEPGPQAVEDETRPLPRGTERILFVDDEAAISDLGRMILESLGYHVSAFNSSLDALSFFATHPDEVDLVLTDYTMPRMSGTDLARAMLKTRPDLPILLCTGFSSQISGEAALALGIRRFLMKPLDVREMAETIRAVLDEQDG
ncbi:MAG: PAS domain S-box protein, partial [Proteobacteria bacterium]|nr:PAS domain S-box protein [Pseudomonadota bacterium]